MSKVVDGLGLRWDDYPGPCYIVEGASDVAAGLTIGLCTVGRPSNLGGVEYLVKLLAGFDREIIVMGERDQKPHDQLADKMQVGHEEDCMGCHRCWPGLYGAERTSEALRERLKRPVAFAFPPGRAKDVRAYVQIHHPKSEDECLSLGKMFSESLTK